MVPSGTKSVSEPGQYYSCARVRVCVPTSNAGFSICETRTQKNVVFVQKQGAAGAPLASWPF